MQSCLTKPKTNKDNPINGNFLSFDVLLITVLTGDFQHFSPNQADNQLVENNWNWIIQYRVSARSRKLINKTEAESLWWRFEMSWIGLSWALYVLSNDHNVDTILHFLGFSYCSYHYHKSKIIARKWKRRICIKWEEFISIML